MSDTSPSSPVEVEHSTIGAQLLDQASAAVEWLRAIHEALIHQAEQLAQLTSSVDALQDRLGALQDQVDALSETVHQIHLETIDLPGTLESSAEGIVTAIEMLEISVG